MKDQTLKRSLLQKLQKVNQIIFNKKLDCSIQVCANIYLLGLEMEKLLSFFGIEIRNINDGKIPDSCIVLDDDHPPPEIIDLDMDEIGSIKQFFSKTAWRLILQRCIL